MRLVTLNEATAAQRRVYFDLRDATDGITAETGVTGQPQISTNGAAFTNTGISTLTEIGTGRYFADLTQAAVNGTAGDVIETRFKSAATAESPGDSVQVVAFDLNVVTQDVNLVQWLGVAPLALLSQRVRTAVGAMDAAVITAAAIATAAIDADALAADAITNAKIAAGAITSSEAPNLDAAVSTRATPVQVNTEVDQALVDIHLDHLLAVVTTSFPGSAGSIFGELIERITTWRYVTEALSQAPAGAADWTSGEKENIRDALGVDGTKTAASGGDVQDIQGRLPASLVGGRMDASVGAMAAAVLTAAAIATDAIDSDALAASAVTEIWAEIVETQGSRTAQQIMSILLSALAGVTDTSGAVFKTPDGVATRITATVNASNERTAITLAPSA